MHSFTHSLFSLRNIILIFLAVFTARSFSAATAELAGTLPGEDLAGLQSGGLEQAPSSILEAFFQGWDLQGEVETIPILAERSVIEEVLGGNDYFILTTDHSVDTRAWLAYLAPEGLTFDLTMHNATISLQSLAAQSEVPFEDASTLGISSNPPQSGFASQEIEVPYEVFFGIELTGITSPELENAFPGGSFPQHSMSEFLLGSNENVPEPSSALLVCLALTASALKRKRL